MTVTLPETRYAKNNGLHVAYQLVGDGPIDVVLLTQWSGQRPNGPGFASARI